MSIMPAANNQTSKTENESHVFYRIFKRVIHDWAERKFGNRENYSRYTLLFPDLLRLLANLTLDDRVLKKQKVELGLSIAFSMSSQNVMGDGMGRDGYDDKICLVMYVLNRLLNVQIDDRVLRDNWPGDEDTLPLTKDILKAANSMLSGTKLKHLNDLLERMKEAQTR